MKKATSWFKIVKPVREKTTVFPMDARMSLETVATETEIPSLIDIAHDNIDTQLQFIATGTGIFLALLAIIICCIGFRCVRKRRRAYSMSSIEMTGVRAIEQNTAPLIQFPPPPPIMPRSIPTPPPPPPMPSHNPFDVDNSKCRNENSHISSPRSRLMEEIRESYRKRMKMAE